MPGWCICATALTLHVGVGGFLGRRPDIVAVTEAVVAVAMGAAGMGVAPAPVRVAAGSSSSAVGVAVGVAEGKDTDHVDQ